MKYGLLSSAFTMAVLFMLLGCWGESKVQPVSAPLEQSPIPPAATVTDVPERTAADAAKEELARVHADCQSKEKTLVDKVNELVERAEKAEFQRDHPKLYAMLGILEVVCIVVLVGGVIIAIALRFYSIPFITGKFAGCLAAGGAAGLAMVLFVGDAAPYASTWSSGLLILAALGFGVYEVVFTGGKAHQLLADAYVKGMTELGKVAPGTRDSLDHMAVEAQGLAGKAVKAVNDKVLAQVKKDL